MELIREIIIPTQSTYTLNIPESMIGKEIEVLAFEIEKGKIISDKEHSLADIKSIFNGARVDLNNFKFNREEANNYDD